MKIFVDNLSFEIMDDFVRAAFEQYGQVASAVIAREHSSSDSSGYAFVDMPVESEAVAAIAALHGKEMMGRPIEVTPARPDSEARRNRNVNPRNGPRPFRPPERHRRPAASVGTGPKSRYGRLG
jgi:RNA recognition motif-containing protein